jgi:ABC-2 type transport system permease protein
MTLRSHSVLGEARAVARRDLSIQLTYHFQLFLQLAQVLFLTMTLYFVSKLVHDPGDLRRYGGHYFEFAVIGMMVMAFVGVGLASFSRSISDEQRAGTLEMLLSSPASLGGLMAGSFAVPAVMAIIEIVVLFGSSVLLFGAHFRLVGILPALPLLALTVATLCALGIFSAAFVLLTKRGDPFTLFAAQITTFLAGAVFPTTLLPGPARALTHLVPTYYSLEGLRAALLTGGAAGELVRDTVVLAAFAVGLLAASMWAFSRSIAVARVTGTLGNY